MKFEKRSNGWFMTTIQGDAIDAYIWCQQLYGQCGDRWEHYAENFMFRKESDLTMFVLRWA